MAGDAVLFVRVWSIARSVGSMLEENPVIAPIGEQEAVHVKPGFDGLAISIVRSRWKVEPEQIGGAGLVFVRLGFGMTVT